MRATLGTQHRSPGASPRRLSQALYFLAVPLACGGAPVRSQGEECCVAQILVRAPDSKPVAGARARLLFPPDAVVATTDAAGLAKLTAPFPGVWRLEVTGDGYELVHKELVILPGRPVEVDLTLPARIRLRESLTVEAPALEPGVSATSEQVAALPQRPATLREALPLIPGVARTPEGKLRIADNPEHRSALMVNLLDVTDPATGDFGATVPIDAVASFQVHRSPFSAEYGRFTAGVVTVHTRGGGQTWRWQLNDPTPEFRLRSRRLRGIRGFTPRLTGSGPVIRDRLYLSQSVEYLLKKTPVFTQPFPNNEERREAWNGLTQLDYVASPTHLVTVTLHTAPQRANFLNIGFYNPRPATPSYAGHEYRAAVADRAVLGGGILESAISVGQTTAKIGAQGDAGLLLRPDGNEGNYFLRQQRHADRLHWLESYAPRPLAAGAHQIKFGGALIYTRARGFFRARPVTVRNWEGELVQRIDFDNRGPFRLSDVMPEFYWQDHWRPLRRLSVDTGLRVDSQSRTGVWRLAPRLGLAWSPENASDTVLRAGFGWFYDRVPLNVHAFDWYPERTVTGFPEGARRWVNRLETVEASRAPLVFGSGRPGNFAPLAAKWHAQAERLFGRAVRLRASYLENRSSGVVVLRPGGGALSLKGEGRASQRQFEMLSRVSWQEGQQLLLSYVRSWSRGHLNDAFEFLGDSPSPLVRPDAFAETHANIPHRFLAWGVIPLTETLRIAPTAEYRTGFPYSPLDAAQNYAGAPNSRRFPAFFSLDLRIAKDIQFRKYKFQVSASGFNLTNHFNPDTVRWNVADPQFGEFLGHRKRRFRMDFDVLF